MKGVCIINTKNSLKTDLQRSVSRTQPNIYLARDFQKAKGFLFFGGEK